MLKINIFIFLICFISFFFLFTTTPAMLGQSNVADIFSMPLGYNNGLKYGPKVFVQDGVTYTDTSYGVKNPGLTSITCFGVAWNELYHAGVDLFRTDYTSTGNDQVTSIANGIVVFAQDVQYPGYVVIVKHEDPFADPDHPKPIFSMYGHLGTINVVAGNTILRGDILGTVREDLDHGFDNSHLHFEIRYFEDAENIYPVSTNCNGKVGKAGVGYTYPEHPDVFPSSDLGYTDPLAFINNRRGMFLPNVQNAELPTPTHTPIPSPHHHQPQHVRPLPPVSTGVIW